MTELLITLMNAPRAVQRSVALAILTMAVIFICVLTSTLVSILTTKGDHIDELRSELFRLEQIIARKPMVAVPETPVHPEQLFVEGRSVSVIQAVLQERVTAVAAKTGATITSMSGLSPAQLDGATYIGLRIDFEGDLHGVHETIRQLEMSQPPLIIRRALIRTNNTYSQGGLTEAIRLSSQISIYGAADPSISLAGEGALTR
ncbi:type II secretion system protein GspM [Rhizobium sp.]|uniref:type II secretion system protein GspM n=1 Tax=Rhizobium sp. TaxID=391 RepID=UPI002898D251